ncbi:MAG TPA: nucleoside-triphosphatase [Elusimicrobiota bacterium]|nr:nucleoside-triphosphatase [Elusimicrobiota bacterium]
MESITTKNLFISGTPRVGKTTLIKESTLPFRERISGFYTSELLERGERIGFQLTSFRGETVLLAGGGIRSAVKVGKYSVDVSAMDRVAVPALREGLSREGQLIVIDEIGSMELHSDLFRQVLLECIQSPAHSVLATIREGSHPFTDHVKRIEGATVLSLAKANYAERRQTVRAWIESRIRP